MKNFAIRTMLMTLLVAGTLMASSSGPAWVSDNQVITVVWDHGLTETYMVNGDGTGCVSSNGVSYNYDPGADEYISFGPSTMDEWLDGWLSGNMWATEPLEPDDIVLGTTMGGQSVSGVVQ